MRDARKIGTDFRSTSAGATATDHCLLRQDFAGARAGIAAAGFLGMFICGGPVYVAGVTTSAINIALIMALSSRGSKSGGAR
jgi:hypothetical protein